MGYDTARFQGEIHKDLICPVCSDVLEEPLQAPQCEHAFCKGCINEWLKRQPSCPIDRQPVSELKPVPRILRNLLSELMILCGNATFGCTVRVKLERLDVHHEECEYNPKRRISHEQMCGPLKLKPPPPPSTQQAKKRLQLIDPVTGKDIFEDLNEETPQPPPVKEENFNIRSNIPRTVPNMGRNNMQTFVNLAQQQAASQYSHMLSTYPINSQQAKKRLQIIHPDTGKDIFEDLNEETPQPPPVKEERVKSAKAVVSSKNDHIINCWLRLGHGGKGLQSCGKGSSGGSISIDSNMKTALTNRYSGLGDQNLTPSFENRLGSQRSAAASREWSRGCSSQLPPTVRKTPSTSREILALNGPELSEHEIEKKTKCLIDEFLHNADFEEAEKCIMELASPVTIHYFIYFAVNQVLGRSSQTRYLFGQLLYSLVKKEIITLEQYKKGFSGVLENIDDYVVDINLISEYVGDILEPMIEDNRLPLSFLKDVLEPCILSETAGKLVSAVLHCAAKNKGTVKLGELWKESGLQWSDFLGTSTNINKFISNHKLEFTVSQTKTVPNAEINIEEIRTKLKELLETDVDNVAIFDYIDANVPLSVVSESAFIRALAQEIHKAAITGVGRKCDLDETLLRKRIYILKRYIHDYQRLELQVLYAIQHLMNDLKQPKGVLRNIFDILYDDEIIAEETFFDWERSEDPAEMKGKGEALNLVRGFFTWLRETESGEEEEDE